MNEEKPNYYSIIPAEVRYDSDLRANEKLLYGEITALSYKTGDCWASNNYFAKLYNVTPQAISLWINNLKNKGYITVEYIKKGNSIDKRIIKLGVSIYVDRVSTNVDGGYQQMFKENNTSINNTSIKENIKRKVFKKPTIDEIKDYCNERNNGINAEAFYDFYESKDWYVGKNKMKDWKACIRTWERRSEPKEEKLPEWWGKKNEDFEENMTDEERREFEAIKNGTYRA